jgi:hypothetical protein
MKKNIFVIYAILTTVVLGWNIQLYSPTVQASSVIQVSGVNDFDGIGVGSGFQLMGKSGLIALAEFVNRGSGVETSGVTFTLLGDNGTSNIDFNDSGISPIGNGQTSSESDRAFHGVFDGSGVIIEKVNVIGGVTGAGFFGHTRQATLKSITLSGVTVNSGTTSVNVVGGLVGEAVNTSIQDVILTGSISITGSDNTGGLVGRAYGGGGSVPSNETITNVTIHATSLQITASGSSQFFGGAFIGRNIGEISNSSVSADNLRIEAEGGSTVGGFVGSNEGSISFSFLSANNITIFGTEELGGFVGYNGYESSGIINSYITASGISIEGTNNLGGFVGYNEKTPILNSYILASGISIDGNNQLGGFVGRNNDVSSISNSFAAIENLTLSGVKNIGGFVGINNDSTIESTYIIGENVSITGTNPTFKSWWVCGL